MATLKAIVIYGQIKLLDSQHQLAMQLQQMAAGYFLANQPVITCIACIELARNILFIDQSSA